MQLRDYQLAAVEAVEDGWKQYRKQLAVLPTGSGKTVLFSHLCDRLEKSRGGKSLILAHSDELISQAIGKLHGATGIFAQKEKAEFKASLSAPVVVASMQTMIKRLAKWPADHFHQIIVDEAHRALSPTYQTILNHFHGNILGVTATPDRGDKKNLGEFFENVAYEISLLELINRGYLSPICIKSIPLKIDLNGVSSSGGEFDEGELGKRLESYLPAIAEAIKQYAPNRKILCFLPLIDTSKKFVDICNSIGIHSKHIDGKSPDRDDILKDFDRGRFQLLSNSILLSEGYDCPSIDCVVVLHTVRSRPRYAQFVGRGTRICEGKSNLLLLDFLWLHEKHKIVHPAALVASNEQEADIITELSFNHSARMPEDIAAQMPLDLRGLASEAQEIREDRLRKELEANALRKSKFISAEEFALQFHVVDKYEPLTRADRLSVSSEQIEQLESALINVDTVTCAGHAAQLLKFYAKKKASQPASTKVKALMERMNWRSSDGLRTSQNATFKDGQIFFMSLRR